MDIIKRAILFGGKAIVTVMETTELCQEASDIHEFSTPVANAMGRALTMTAFMSGNFKAPGNAITIIMDGKGPIGQMVMCGSYGAKVRAYCENPKASILNLDATCSQVVGHNGNMQVIKDFGLKKPYNGLCELVNGSISSDFAYYFTISEQLPSAVALGCKFENGKCLKSGGIIVQPMPNCDENELFVLEDIVNNFQDVVALMQEKSVEEILEFYFGHFEIKILDDIFPQWQCECSKDKIERMVISLGKEEALNIIEDEGKIEAGCQFCKKTYTLNKMDVEKLFDGKNC